jgi:N-acetylneuraminate synthase
LEFLSTPFHEEAVEFLEKLNVSCYKIASFENNHIPLIEAVSQTKKPVIVSTGMASIQELNNVKNILNKNKNQFVFLKCTSAYPATAKSFNLNTLKDMEKKFNCIVGLSDHSLGSVVATSSVALGARVIEKHLTISKNDNAIDSFFSSDKISFKKYVQDIKLSFESLGNNFYGSTKEENSSLQERRSIYVKKNIKKGEYLTKNNIAVIRPSFGLDPIYFNEILGRKCKRNLLTGSRLTKKSF